MQNYLLENDRDFSRFFRSYFRSISVNTNLKQKFIRQKLFVEQILTATKSKIVNLKLTCPQSVTCKPEARQFKTFFIKTISFIKSHNFLRIFYSISIIDIIIRSLDSSYCVFKSPYLFFFH